MDSLQTGKRIALIGGSGFIGTELIHVLSAGNDVVNYDVKPSSLSACQTILVDVRDKEALVEKMQPADWLILLAGEATDALQPVSLYYEIITNGAANALAAMSAKGITNILFISTVAVYSPHQNKADETVTPHPFNDYGKAKWQAEELLRRWYEQDAKSRTLVIVRPAVVYGPGNKGNIHQLLQQVMSGRFIMIGKGSNKKSMAYIDNIVGFLTYLMGKNTSGYHLYNYADKPDVSTKEVISFIYAALRKKPPRFSIPYTAGLVIGFTFDIISKLLGKKIPIGAARVKKWAAATEVSSSFTQSTGYEQKVSWQEGLQRTIAFLQQQNISSR